ncbi:MAG: CHAD domain-containing protein [bacterium]|nr:CHAD domain-containing protein [bacterium]
MGRALVAFYLASFAANAEAAHAGDVEGVHQLRVATRRIRVALRLFERFLPAATVAALMDGFAELGRGIGSVRDLDVLAAAIAAGAERLDPAARRALPPLADYVAAERVRALEALRVRLGTPRVRRLLARAEKLGATGPRGAPVRLAEVAPAVTRPLLRGVERRGRALASRDAVAKASDEALHELRVRVKRLRYACEALAGLDPEAMGPVVARLVTLQDVLGDHQDAVMQAAWLHAAAQRTSFPPATLLATGGLLAGLARRARRRRRRFLGAWRRFERRGTKRRAASKPWVPALAPAPPPPEAPAP